MKAILLVYEHKNIFTSHDLAHSYIGHAYANNICIDPIRQHFPNKRLSFTVVSTIKILFFRHIFANENSKHQLC